ncbi:MAG: T9SS type A sorting domain-containing protein [Bacteroidales bacterium]|nr:T9SS type A sorting domain-containing protein [Bacteroidales bacterium]
MKHFTRLFSLIIALTVTFSFANAQQLKTKAQALGLKTSGVTITPAKDLTSTRAILLEEGFDTDWLPTDWSVINFHPANNWMQGNPQDNNFNEIDPNSLFSALVPWIGEDQDEWLISPELDAGGETPLNLSWYAGVSGSWLDPGATLICHISTDGGTTWTPLWDAIDEIEVGAPWAWNYVSINLDAYAGAPFKLAWQYVGNDGDLAGVDGVKVKTGYDYIFQDDMESYNVGDYLALTDTSGFWTTWTDNPGSAEDAFIVDAQAASGTQSTEVVTTSTDLILKLGDKTTGKYQVDMKYYIVSGMGGYVNLQHFEAPGIEWAVEVYFGAGTGNNNGFMYAGSPDSIYFTHPHDTWMQLSFVVDLDNDWAEFYLDDVLITEWQFSLQAQGDPGTLQLGGVDIYGGAPQGDSPHYYFDDVEYIVLVEGATSATIDIDNSPISVVLEEGDQTTEQFSMGNTGEGDLNYEMVITYPQGNKALDIEPAGSNTPKDMNQVLIADPDYVGAINELGNREVVLNYDGDNASAIGTSTDYEWRVAARFPSDMVTPYVGMEITSVDVFINDPGTAYKLQIYGMGSFNTPGPGELLLEQSFDAIGASWNTITLDNPVKIDGQNIWVGYWFTSTGGLFTPGVDAGPVAEDGDWMAAGPGWSHLSDNPDLQFNWNIRANLTGEAMTAWLSTDPTEGTLVKDEYIDVDVNIDASGLTSDQYQGKINVRNNDPENELVKITVLLNVTVGINENGEKEFVVVYPNPAKDYLRIGTNGDLTHVRIVNTIGQVVFDQQMDQSNATISTSNLESGVYFVQIDTEHGTTTQKIVIE